VRKTFAMDLTDLNEIGFFEGTEKLLEIWFQGRDGEENCDLRSIPRPALDSLLKIVQAEIVSHTQNEYIDSYVLSESSMFISKNRFIIKTCGITRLLHAVKPIIQLAQDYANMPIVQDFFYSRRVYLRPDEQKGIHKGFQMEAAFLNIIIPGGRTYVLGAKKEEQWYLFSLTHPNSSTPSNDVTLEILMSNLDESTMTNFTKKKYETSDELAVGTGISWIIPGSVNDGLVFDPIGFSMNGLFKDSYYTIHVTPQPMCSYVSFETNIRQHDYSELVNRVIKTFKPGKFIVTLFSNKDAMCGSAKEALQRCRIRNYDCDDQHCEQLENYSLAYQFYVQQ